MVAKIVFAKWLLAAAEEEVGLIQVVNEHRVYEVNAEGHLAQLDVDEVLTVHSKRSNTTNWQSGLHLTHYWDCSGQGCDAPILQPWDESKYVSPPGYGPQDPADHGGALYGEKMWLTGAASDVLSSLMGDNDPCCGRGGGDDNSGGCGKCLLVENPDAVNSDWTAIVMKKNRCPPWTNGCDSNKPHFDVAAPGFDNLKWSTANICGMKPGTGFSSQQQSEAVGNWWSECSNTADCQHLCDKLPVEFQKGCKLFASWGWTRGDPTGVRYKAVACPQAFKDHVQSQFGPNGPTASGDSGGGASPQPSPSPTPTPPSGSGSCADDESDCRSSGCCQTAGKTCYEKDGHWASCRDSCTPGINPDDPPAYQTAWSCKVLGSSGSQPMPQPGPAPEPEPETESEPESESESEPEGESGGPCAHWCPLPPVTWKRKCTWPQCSGCGMCHAVGATGAEPEPESEPEPR